MDCETAEVLRVLCFGPDRFTGTILYDRKRQIWRSEDMEDEQANQGTLPWPQLKGDPYMGPFRI